MTALTLVSHHLCPYVQRAAIALVEKDAPFERLTIDLSDKPAWFRALSPLGKVPLLKVVRGGREATIFESSVILEFLEDTLPVPLHPSDPLERARHRAWIEYGSSILNGIARFYNAKTEAALLAQGSELATKFAWVEEQLGDGVWFGGTAFSLVDAVYGPIFRYFDTFDQIDDFQIISRKPRLAAWRQALAGRPSVRDAVAPDYPDRLLSFLQNRGSALSRRIEAVRATS